MFGRLKLALVALILMPATAFAANEGERHLPGSAAAPVTVSAKALPSDSADAGKHHSSAKAVVPPSTIAAFIAGLRDQPLVVASIAKPAAAGTPFFAGFSRPDLHRPV